MTAEELARVLIEARVIRTATVYDDEYLTDHEVVRTAGCDCCSDVATLPPEVAALLDPLINPT